MRRRVLIVIVAASLLGAVLAGLTTAQHFRIMREGFEQESYCAISEKINCDIVNASSYSEFLGVPIAWWGFIFYLLTGGMCIFSFLSKKDRRATVIVVCLMAAGAILYSVYLAYVAVFVLGAVCIECLGMYLANLVIFIGAFVAMKLELRNLVTFIPDYFRAVFGRASNLGFSPGIAGHAALVIAAYLVGWLVIANVQAGDKGLDIGGSVAEKVSAFYMQSEHSVEVDPNWPVWGNPEAKVTVIEFSEFQCPFCRLAAFGIRPYLQEFKNNVRYFFVNYPLDNSCNDQVSHAMHQFACLAGKAGFCANKYGDFWAFHDELYRNQQRLSEELILSLAKKRGWDPDEFKECISSPEAEERIKKDIAAANKIYVTGTPAIFLDRRKVRYWRDHKFLQAVVREEIKKTKKNH